MAIGKNVQWIQYLLFKKCICIPLHHSNIFWNLYPNPSGSTSTSLFLHLPLQNLSLKAASHTISSYQGDLGLQKDLRLGFSCTNYF